MTIGGAQRLPLAAIFPRAFSFTFTVALDFVRECEEVQRGTVAPTFSDLAIYLDKADDTPLLRQPERR
jgi:hypothetical protein